MKTLFVIGSTILFAASGALASGGVDCHDPKSTRIQYKISAVKLLCFHEGEDYRKRGQKLHTNPDGSDREEKLEKHAEDKLKEMNLASKAHADAQESAENSADSQMMNETLSKAQGAASAEISYHDSTISGCNTAQKDLERLANQCPNIAEQYPSFIKKTDESLQKMKDMRNQALRQRQDLGRSVEDSLGGKDNGFADSEAGTDNASADPGDSGADQADSGLDSDSKFEGARRGEAKSVGADETSVLEQPEPSEVQQSDHQSELKQNLEEPSALSSVEGEHQEMQQPEMGQVSPEENPGLVGEVDEMTLQEKIAAGEPLTEADLADAPPTAAESMLSAGEQSSDDLEFMNMVEGQTELPLANDPLNELESVGQNEISPLTSEEMPYAREVAGIGPEVQAVNELGETIQPLNGPFESQPMHEVPVSEFAAQESVNSTKPKYFSTKYDEFGKIKLLDQPGGPGVDERGFKKEWDAHVTWYGGQFNGQKTKYGNIFDKNAGPIGYVDVDGKKLPVFEGASNSVPENYLVHVTPKPDRSGNVGKPFVFINRDTGSADFGLDCSKACNDYSGFGSAGAKFRTVGTSEYTPGVARVRRGSGRYMPNRRSQAGRDYYANGGKKKWAIMPDEQPK